MNRSAISSTRSWEFYVLAENQKTKYVHKFHVLSDNFNGRMSSLSSQRSAPWESSAPLATSQFLSGITVTISALEISFD